jgi:methyl-accepting chemotaxis protein
MFKKLTVRGRLILLGVIAGLTLILVGGVGFYAATSLSDALSDAFVSLRAQKNQGEADMMHDALRADVLLALRGAQRNDAEMTKTAQEDTKKHSDNLSKLFADNETLALGAATKAAMLKAKPDLAAYQRGAAQLVTTAKTDAATAERDSGDFFQLFNKLEVSLAEVAQQIEKESDGSTKAATAKAALAVNLILGASVAALVLIGLFALMTYRAITRSLATLQSTVAKVGAGDLAARSKLRSGDEMQTLGDAFDGLLDDRLSALAKAEKENDQLNTSVIGLLTTVAELSQRNLTVKAPVTEDIIGTVSDSINQLTDATSTVLRDVTKIAGVVEHASKRVKQQSDAVNAVADAERITVERLVGNLRSATTAMEEVSKLAQTSNVAAAEASTSTESAMKTVDTTVRGMDAIRETISEMEKRIKRLGERSQEISQIVGLINTISERTHVLSLNASMQAAMAGDAGRGFAVVAEEVQRLAENSRQATAQIANLVQNIQIETNDTIATVNKTIDQVVQGSEMARSSGERMRETRASTQRLVQMVQTIAQSTQGQMALAGELQSAANEITASTQKTAEQLSQQNQVTSSLVTASQKLVESVSVFKLSAQT